MILNFLKSVLLVALYIGTKKMNNDTGFVELKSAKFLPAYFYWRKHKKEIAKYFMEKYQTIDPKEIIEKQEAIEKQKKEFRK